MSNVQVWCFLWDLEVGGPLGTLVWVEGSNEKVNAHHVEPSGVVQVTCGTTSSIGPVVVRPVDHHFQ